ncbi:MAG TPA: MFS transporter [Candidatus Nanoarchaeia archaeon]|nr:MFS transporter [Candidatus Nanoarchaeia archaeon]
MEFLKHIHIKKFFQNKELKHFYITVMLINFGIALISIFVPIYLYKIGYPIYQIALFYALTAIYFVVLAYPSSKIISQLGIKHSILIATPFIILFFLGLNFIEKFPLLFFIIPLFDALNKIFYWNGYHLFFFLHSDKKKRGREMSIIQIISFLSMAIAPFIGGLIAKETTTLLFSIGSLFVLIGVFPLFLTKENYCPKKFNFKKFIKDFFSKKEKRDILSFSGYATESIIERTIWPIFLIIILGTYEKTGAIVSITTFLSVIGLYFSGKLSDKYNKRKLVKLWTGIHAISWIGRIFSNNALKITIVDSYKKITNKFLHIPWITQIYKLANKRDYFEFILFEHIVFYSIRALLLPLIALIFYLDFYPFIISFSIAAIASLLYPFINKK